MDGTFARNGKKQRENHILSQFLKKIKRIFLVGTLFAFMKVRVEKTW